jgi:hypothetical protein
MEVAMAIEHLWDVKKLADFLGLPSVNAARIMCSRGEVPFIKIGHRVRFCPLQIQKWLKNKRVEAR